MNIKATVPWVLLAAFLAATGVGLVYARQAAEGGNDALQSVGKAKFSLAQAVGVAEARAGGKAIRAELESMRNAPSYDVEVVTAGNRVFDVKIDALDGKVLASKMDETDRHDADEDRRDDDNRHRETKGDRE